MGWLKPNRIHTILEDGVANAGAQVVVFSPNVAIRLSIRKEEMIDIDTELETASGELLKIMEGLPVILTIKPEDTEEVEETCQMETHQMAYVALGGTCLVVNRLAMCELGLVPVIWPHKGVGNVVQLIQGRPKARVRVNDNQRY